MGVEPGEPMGLPGSRSQGRKGIAVSVARCVSPNSPSFSHPSVIPNTYPPPNPSHTQFRFPEPKGVVSLVGSRNTRQFQENCTESGAVGGRGREYPRQACGRSPFRKLELSNPLTLFKIDGHGQKGSEPCVPLPHALFWFWGLAPQAHVAGSVGCHGYTRSKERNVHRIPEFSGALV